MKYRELQAVAERLNGFEHITRARRVEENTIEIVFDKTHAYRFDMTRGHSTVYKAPSKRPAQGFNAPFDTLLHSLLSGGKLFKAEVERNDRILRLHVASRSAYKSRRTILQLEFTGRHTNAILLDEENRILEALRHIDAQSSFRVVRPGVILQPLPPRKQKYEATEETIAPEEIDTVLETRFAVFEKQRLEALKKQHIQRIEKKIETIARAINALPDETQLKKEAEIYTHYATLVLANLHRIEPYNKVLETVDFEGNRIVIPLPESIKPARMGDYYFNLAKRARNKAANVHIERDNLMEKKAFYENIAYALAQAKTLYDIELLAPKRGKARRKKEKFKEGELFWIEDYKVMVGRNARENQALLKAAKSNDIWMHVRDIPGSHVIIRTDKQNLPDTVLQAAAKLCADFSTDKPGNYLVDYTKRKFVKIQEGAHVEYDKYQTIPVLKEGVEIRE